MFISKELWNMFENAIDDENIEYFSYLLSRYPKSIIQTYRGLSLINKASMSGKNDIIALLIDKGASLEADGSRKKPIHYAALGGRNSTIDYFIKQLKIDPKILTNQGQSLLHWAAVGIQPATINHLIINYNLTIQSESVDTINNRLLKLCLAMYAISPEFTQANLIKWCDAVLPNRKELLMDEDFEYNIIKKIGTGKFTELKKKYDRVSVATPKLLMWPISRVSKAGLTPQIWPWIKSVEPNNIHQVTIYNTLKTAVGPQIIAQPVIIAPRPTMVSRRIQPSSRNAEGLVDTNSLSAEKIEVAKAKKVPIDAKEVPAKDQEKPIEPEQGPVAEKGTIQNNIEEKVLEAQIKMLESEVEYMQAIQNLKQVETDVKKSKMDCQIATIKMLKCQLNFQNAKGVYVSLTGEWELFSASASLKFSNVKDNKIQQNVANDHNNVQIVLDSENSKKALNALH